MSKDNIIIEQKVVDFLNESYENFKKDKGVNVLDDESDKIKLQKKFKQLVESTGKNIAEMTDKEKKDLFNKIKNDD